MFIIIFYIKTFLNFYLINVKNGDWGLGIGDWGLGISDWSQSPIPNPQSPILKPQKLINKKNIQFLKAFKLFLFIHN